MPISILSIFFIVAFMILLATVYIKALRYGSSREVILNLFCYLQGRRSRWIRDPELAQRVLQSSATKGLCIEQLISYNAFLPVMSLESVDGDQWFRMKRNFLLLRAQLPPLHELATISSTICEEYLFKKEVIDSPCLVRIIFYSMLKWIFNLDEPGDPASLEFVLDGILEWRKELAIKGTGNMVMKLKVIEWIKKLIRESKYEDLFGDNWEDPEYWSLILQPFIISPIINFTDVAVTLASEPLRSEYLRNGTWNEQLFLSAVNLNHPFPVLERWFPDGLVDTHGLDTGETNYIIPPNTHVFLPMDVIGRKLCQGPYTNTSWAAFGAGKRACAGRDIVSTLSSQLFQQLMTHPKFKPSVNHTYSGRDNDSKETLAHSWFQVCLMIRIIWRLLKKRFDFKAPLTSSSYSQMVGSSKQKCKNPPLIF